MSSFLHNYPSARHGWGGMEQWLWAERKTSNRRKPRDSDRDVLSCVVTYPYPSKNISNLVPCSRGPLRAPTVLVSTTQIQGGTGAKVGWLGLVEFDVVDRQRSRATDGHSVNATRKTKNQVFVRHKAVLHHWRYDSD